MSIQMSLGSLPNFAEASYAFIYELITYRRIIIIPGAVYVCPSPSSRAVMWVYLCQ